MNRKTFLITCVIVGILASCSKSPLETDNHVNQKQPYLKDYLPFSGSNFQYAGSRDIPTGTYLIKNHWTNGFLSVTKDVSSNSWYLTSNPRVTGASLWRIVTSDYGEPLFNLHCVAMNDKSLTYRFTYDNRVFMGFEDQPVSMATGYQSTIVEVFTSQFYIVRNSNQSSMSESWALCPFNLSGYIPDIGVINTEKGGKEGTNEVDYSFKAPNGSYYTSNTTGANSSTWASAAWEWNWWSKDWQISQSKIMLADNFLDATKSTVGGNRYIYRCMGSQSTPSDAGQLQYKPSDDGWWDADGDGFCAKLSYTNVLDGIAGFGVNLSSGAPIDLSKYGGIMFWASSDFGKDDGTGPLAEIHLASSNINSNGWLGNYWHGEFHLPYNWKQFNFSFNGIYGASFSAPVFDSSITLKECLKQAISLEFQQGITDNKSGSNLQGNIYIDDVIIY